MDFQALQKNNNEFRAQLLKTGVNGGLILWVIESAEENYFVVFDQVIAVEAYCEDKSADRFQVVILVRNTSDDELTSQEIGVFSKTDALNFATWFKTQVKQRWA
jgi:hypothetical protein